jgi:hypothetical protein
MMKVIAQIEDFRFVEKGIIEINGMPDYRLQVQDYYTKRFKDVYLFDNKMQFETALNDLDYAKWLLDRPCYRGRLSEPVAS